MGTNSLGKSASAPEPNGGKESAIKLGLEGMYNLYGSLDSHLRANIPRLEAAGREIAIDSAIDSVCRGHSEVPFSVPFSRSLLRKSAKGRGWQQVSKQHGITIQSSSIYDGDSEYDILANTASSRLEEGDPEAILIPNNRVDEIQQAISQLPDPERIVFQCRIIKDLSFEETAVLLKRIGHRDHTDVRHARYLYHCAVAAIKRKLGVDDHNT